MNDKISEYTRLAVQERKAAARARSAAEAALLRDIANQYDVMAEKAAGRPTLTPITASKHSCFKPLSSPSDPLNDA